MCSILQTLLHYFTLLYQNLTFTPVTFLATFTITDFSKITVDLSGRGLFERAPCNPLKSTSGDRLLTFQRLLPSLLFSTPPPQVHDERDVGRQRPVVHRGRLPGEPQAGGHRAQQGARVGEGRSGGAGGGRAGSRDIAAVLH